MRSQARCTALTVVGAMLEWASSPRQVTRMPDLALVRRHHLQAGGLADDAEARPPGQALHHVDQPADAEAADLLIVAEGKMQGLGEPAFAATCAEHAEAAGDEPLHVGAAAGVEPAVGSPERERVGRPGLALGGNDVAVPRKHDALAVAGPDGRQEIGLASVFAGDQPAAGAHGFDLAAHEVDEVEIAVAAHRRKSDEFRQIVDAG